MSGKQSRSAQMLRRSKGHIPPLVGTLANRTPREFHYSCQQLATSRRPMSRWLRVDFALASRSCTLATSRWLRALLRKVVDVLREVWVVRFALSLRGGPRSSSQSMPRCCPSSFSRRFTRVRPIHAAC